MNTLDSWCGKFGTDYAMRNKPNFETVQKRAKVFEEIIPPLKPVGILEVGCNIGLNLIAIDSMLQPPNYIAGVEPNERVARVAQIAGFKVWVDIGEDLLFPDESFDLVFTCGVLIHNEPSNCRKIVKEMQRVSRRYLLFMEYFSDKDEHVPYRDDVYLWKRPWPKYFREWGLGGEVSRGTANNNQGFDNVNWWVYKK